ncbi:MAG: LLM class flavin-dependent oxidoreductase [Dehalococcoidia bacterium]|jgi:alkanesulfonate monooxygenase SsuD/methylene tetrahydromethanopterin reductase-like flavin-dependent oxidoreductase (luciferase family)|nr:LLM class flavin-dependent oxidoreductase [Dehalococcoidia bacterium]
MITKFDSLFAGHVDMTDIGYAGTAVNDRKFDNEHLMTVYSKAEAIAKALDENGFDTMWMAEHHFQPEGYECIPNLIMLNVHLSHLTKNLRFGCGFNIAPMWHPLRLAEDFATADILTKGRVTFGVGRGYHTREVETFGSDITDQDANREKFEESVDIIFKAFNNESFSHQGKYYTLPPEVPYRGYTLKELTLVPRPATLPVECWQPIQGGTQRALDFMVKHGIKGVLGGGVAEGGVMDDIMTGYRDALIRAGKKDAQLGEGLSVGFHFHMAPTVEQAMQEAQGFFEENLKMFGPLRLSRGMTDEQIDIIGDPRRAPTGGLPTIQEAVKKQAFLAGPPDRIIEQLKAVEEAYPALERIGMSHPMGTPQSVITDQIEWFGKEVMPAFKGK